MPKPLTPQDQWETEFEVPIPGEPRRIGPLEVLFQRLLNRTERLKAVVSAIMGVPWGSPPPTDLATLDSRLSTLEEGIEGPYDLLIYTPGYLAGGQTLARLLIPRALTLATTGHAVSCDAAPSANWSAQIRRNGVSIGSVSIPAGSTSGTVSLTAYSLAAGDILTIVAQATTDSSLQGVAIALKGVV